MTELKPCPFCGGKAKLFMEKLAPLLQSQMITVRCESCYAESCTSIAVYGEVSEQAGCIEAWNKRA